MHDKKQKGAVLLMTLIVALVLTVFVARNFENTSKELVALKNEEIDFQLKTLSLSALKAILQLIISFDGASQGANAVKDIFAILNEHNIPIPLFPDDIPNLFITEPKMWSMDHYFYLNNLNAERQNALVELLPEYLDISSDSIDEEFYQDVVQNICTLLGGRICSNSRRGSLGGEIAIEPKNALLDSAAELKFLIVNTIETRGDEIRDIAKLEENMENLPIINLPQVYMCEGSTACVGKLNLNMLPKCSISSTAETEHQEVVVKYFDFFVEKIPTKKSKQQKQKKKILENKSTLMSTISEQFACGFSSEENLEEEGNSETNNSEEESLFTTDSVIGSFLKLGDGNFSANSSIITANQEFFTYRSRFVGLSFNIEIGETVRTVTAHLQLEYEGDNNTAQPDEIIVFYYRIS